jgi:hypothetical protein
VQKKEEMDEEEGDMSNFQGKTQSMRTRKTMPHGSGVRLYLTAPRNPITGAVDIFDKLRDLYRFK